MNRAWTNSGYLPPTWPFGGGSGGGGEGGTDPNAVHHVDFAGVDPLPAGSTIAQIEGKVNTVLTRLKGAIAIALSFSFMALGAAEVPPDTPLRNVNTLTTVRDVVTLSALDAITNRNVGTLSADNYASNSILWHVAKVEEASHPVVPGAGILVEATETNNVVSLDPASTNVLWEATTTLVNRVSLDATNYVDTATNDNWSATTCLVNQVALDFTNYVDSATNDNWSATTVLVNQVALDLTNYVDTATNDNWSATTCLVNQVALDLTNYVDTATNDNWSATTCLVNQVALDLTNYVDTATNDNWSATTVAVNRVAFDATNYTDSVLKNLGTGAARPLPKYLHELSLDSTYPDDAKWYYEQAARAYHGSCSVRRVGDIVERNYDWNFDDSAVFVIRMSAAPGRFASIGMAGAGTNLTEEIVTSGKWSRYYKCLPGHMLDGINEKGVFAEINVVNGDPLSPGKWVLHPDPEDGVHPLAAVRWVLDNASSAEEAANYLIGAIAFPEGWTQNFHYFVADASGTWLVEDGKVKRLYPGQDVVTNFKLNPWVDGPGIERYNILMDGQSITNAWYTRTYAADTNWRSEFDFNDAALAAAKALWATGDKESHRGQTDGTNGWWQTVHTAVYDISALSMKVAVQETDDWYEFRCSTAGGGGSITRQEFDSATNDVWTAKRDKEDMNVYSNVLGYVVNPTPEVLSCTGADTPEAIEAVVAAIVASGFCPRDVTYSPATGTGGCVLDGSFTYGGMTFSCSSGASVSGEDDGSVTVFALCSTADWTGMANVVWKAALHSSREVVDRIATTNEVVRKRDVDDLNVYGDVWTMNGPTFDYCPGIPSAYAAEMDAQGFRPYNLRLDEVTGGLLYDLPDSFVCDGKTFVIGSEHPAPVRQDDGTYVIGSFNPQSSPSGYEVLFKWTGVRTVTGVVDRLAKVSEIPVSVDVTNVVRDVIPEFSFCRGKSYERSSDVDVATFTVDCAMYDGGPKVLERVGDGEWLYEKHRGGEDTLYRVTATDSADGVVFHLDATLTMAGVDISIDIGDGDWPKIPEHVFTNAMVVSLGGMTVTSDVTVAAQNMIVSERKLSDALRSLEPPSVSGEFVTDGTNTLHSDRSFVVSRSGESSYSLNFTLSSDSLGDRLFIMTSDGENSWTVGSEMEGVSGYLRYDTGGSVWRFYVEQGGSALVDLTHPGTKDDLYVGFADGTDFYGIPLPSRNPGAALRCGKTVGPDGSDGCSVFQRAARVWEIATVGFSGSTPRVFLTYGDDGHWRLANYYDCGRGQLSDTTIGVPGYGVTVVLDAVPESTFVTTPSDVSGLVKDGIPNYSFTDVAAWQSWDSKEEAAEAIPRFRVRLDGSDDPIYLDRVGPSPVWSNTVDGVTYRVECHDNPSGYLEYRFILSSVNPSILVPPAFGFNWFGSMFAYVPECLILHSATGDSRIGANVEAFDQVASRSYVDAKAGSGGTDGEAVTNIVRNFEKEIVDYGDFPLCGISEWYLETSLAAGHPLILEINGSAWESDGTLPGAGRLHVDLTAEKVDDVVMFTPHVTVGESTRFDLDPFSGTSNRYDLASMGFGIVDVWVPNLTSPLTTKEYVDYTVATKAATAFQLSEFKTEVRNSIGVKRNADDLRDYAMVLEKDNWTWSDFSGTVPASWIAEADLVRSPVPTYEAGTDSYRCGPIGGYQAISNAVPERQLSADYALHLDFAFTNTLTGASFVARASRTSYDSTNPTPRPTGDELITTSTAPYRSEVVNPTGGVVLDGRRMTVVRTFAPNTESCTVTLPYVVDGRVSDSVVRFDNTGNIKGVDITLLAGNGSPAQYVDKFDLSALSVPAGSVVYMTFTGFRDADGHDRFLVSSNGIVTE